MGHDCGAMKTKQKDDGIRFPVVLSEEEEDGEVGSAGVFRLVLAAR